MSLLDQDNFIEINLYYKYVNSDYGKKLIILSDENGKKMFTSNEDVPKEDTPKEEGATEDVKKSEKVERLETKWILIKWKEQNEVMEVASQVLNPQTGERQFNFISYRDAIIKKCLKAWNIIVKDQLVPVTPSAIDSLPGPIVTNLYEKFEEFIDYTEQELGN